MSDMALALWAAGFLAIIWYAVIGPMIRGARRVVDAKRRVWETDKLIREHNARIALTEAAYAEALAWVDDFGSNLAMFEAVVKRADLDERLEAKKEQVKRRSVRRRSMLLA